MCLADRREHFANLPRARFLSALSAEGIPASAGYTPLNKEPFIKQTLDSRGYRAAYSPERLARCKEADLRACKMGFRAPYLLETARAVAGGQFDLPKLAGLPMEMARAELMNLPGVGRKIADCVLLFAYGFPTAFPVDVWVMKALKQLYFPRRRKVNLRWLHRFSEEHFGPHGGYAQQYLFHYMRMKGRKAG